MVFVPSKRMLSIQSHVVTGYCGNRSATFPLQLLEFETDVINTVQLSNHTQYKVVRGQIFGSKELKDIHEGLKGNQLLSLYDNILSGYVADVSYIESLALLVKDIKKSRHDIGLDCWYTLDPVLGDDDTGYYVPNGVEIANSYKKNLLPLADIITPNRFEASILSGQEIDASSDQAFEQAFKAIDILHNYGVKVVVVTSFELTKSNQELNCLLSYKSPTTNSSQSSHANGDTFKSSDSDSSSSEAWIIKIPKLDCPFTGTGDLFAALLTGWLRKTNFHLKLSLEKTVNSIHEIVGDTFAWYKHINDNSVRSHELRLVQNKQSIMFPNDKLIAERVEKSSLSQTVTSNRAPAADIHNVNVPLVNQNIDI